MLKTIMQKFRDFKIGTKIIVCYIIISIISISFSTFIYQKINEKIMTQKVSDMAVQTLETIASNIDLLIYTVNNESKILLSNQNLQSILRSGDEKFNYNNQTFINRYLTEFIQSNMSISSVYVFDNHGNRYYVDKRSFKTFGLEDIKESPWYDQLQRAQGGYLVKLNGGDLFNQPDHKYISLIRIINDLDSQKPIGIMMINIPEEAIINSFKNIMDNDATTILLKDENNNDIIHSKDIKQFNVLENVTDKMKAGKYYTIEKVKSKDYITSYLKNDLKWTMISIEPFSELSKQTNIYRFVILAMLLLSGILSFSGLILASSYITKPIIKLIKSMKGVEKGEFKKVNIETGNDEIGKLKNVYNTMIYEIENLIDQIVREQKIKRKAELDVLQSQIKPHFLYNTFDAISSLALDGRTEDVYSLIKALGNFYRTSLSNGKEVITIEEELLTVKSYLTIQQIRYYDLFNVEFNIDEEANQYKILKLVLQPLVENAIYHGIKPIKRKGTIYISSSFKDEYVELIVQDNGAGMNEDILRSVQEDKISGIGLRGTLERLSIFYNGKSSFAIESKEGEGTKITINIPISQEENYG